MIDREALRIRRKRGIIMARCYRNQLTPRNIGFLGTTPRPCSCWMCGNPRRHSKGDFAITMQERRAKLADMDYASHFLLTLPAIACRLAEKGGEDMPSTDITTCASLHCPKRWRCAEHFSNNVIDSMYASHYDAYKPKIGGCENFREIKPKD